MFLYNRGMITTMPMKSTTLYLADEHREAIRLIRERYGLRGDAAAVRLALILVANEIRQAQGRAELPRE